MSNLENNTTELENLLNMAKNLPNANAGGTDNALIVTGTLAADESGNLFIQEPSHTFEEIQEAANNNYRVLAKIDAELLSPNTQALIPLGVLTEGQIAGFGAVLNYQEIIIVFTPSGNQVQINPIASDSKVKIIDGILGIDENNNYTISIQETFANIKQAVEDGCTAILKLASDALIGASLTTFANLVWIHEDQLCFEAITEFFNQLTHFQGYKDGNDVDSIIISPISIGDNSEKEVEIVTGILGNNLTAESLSHTYDQIVELVNSGKQVILKLADSEDSSIGLSFIFSAIVPNTDGQKLLIFSSSLSLYGTTVFYYIAIAPDGTTTGSTEGIYSTETLLQALAASSISKDNKYFATSGDVYDALNGLTETNIPKAINEALATAKESGEFDGEDGAPGPQGPEGPQGPQGIQGLQGDQGPKGDTGEKGADGISATHSWNGTTLIITSASGTSSADLKGEKGDKGDKGDTGATGEQGPKGDKGDTGEQGPAGKTPVKGDDYFTATDKAEFLEEVKNSIDIPESVTDLKDEANYATKTWAEEILNGKCKAYVFDYRSKEDPNYQKDANAANKTVLEDWLLVIANISNLRTGDVFLIRDVGVPDYWWDGDTSSKQILETTKVPLEEYAKLTDLENFVDLSYVTQELAKKLNTTDTYVKTVNGQSGVVTLTIPSTVAQLSDASNYVQLSTLQTELAKKLNTTDTYVKTINGQSGAVTLTIPTALSQLSGDSTHRVVTDAEKTAWNAKSNFSGNYNDLTNKPIANGALVSPLTVTGGDSEAAGKIILDENGQGQITNSSTSTLFGFLNNSDLSVGSTSYNLKLRGKATRPKYNDNDLALKSDISTNADTVDNLHFVASNSAPASGTSENVITFVY